VQFDQLKRREFITLLGGAVVAWPVAAHGQQGERVRRIGMFMPGMADDPEYQARNAAFLQGLGELGWTRPQQRLTILRSLTSAIVASALGRVGEPGNVVVHQKRVDDEGRPAAHRS
jgi:hypothetical protein